MAGNIGSAPGISNNNNEENSSTSVGVSVTAGVPTALKGVVNGIDFLFTIKTPKKDETKARAPCDISLVLDRSGSMAGMEVG